jgi:hypothetical protein
MAARRPEEISMDFAVIEGSRAGAYKRVGRVTDLKGCRGGWRVRARGADETGERREINTAAI